MKKALILTIVSLLTNYSLASYTNEDGSYAEVGPHKEKKDLVDLMAERHAHIEQLEKEKAEKLRKEQEERAGEL